MLLTMDSLPQQRMAQLHRLRRRALKCQPCWYSQAPRRKRAKALFRRLPGACSVPRATTQRRRICASRCCLDLVSIRDQKLFVAIRDDLSSARVGRRCAAFEASPEERSNAGASEQKNALALFRAGVVSTAVAAACRRFTNRASEAAQPLRTLVPDAVGSAATPNPCARDVANDLYTNCAPRW